MEKKSAMIIAVVIVGIVVIVSLTTGFFDKITGRAIVEKDLVVYYGFEENVKDLSGNKHDALLYGVGPQYVQGRFGNAVTFDSSDDYIFLEDNDDFRLQKFTLGFWAKLNDPAKRWNGGIGRGRIYGGNWEFTYRVIFDRNEIKAGVTNIKDGYYETSTSADDTDWHFWTMTVGDNSLKLYKDGLIMGNTEYQGELEYNKLYREFIIGSRKGEYYLDGLIDEVKLWNYVMSPEEILAEYNSLQSIEYCGNDICDHLQEDYKTCPEDCVLCFDSDYGYEVYLKGECEDFSGIKLTDHCVSGGEYNGYLMEASCDELNLKNGCQEHYHECIFGCSKGVCLTK